VFEFTFAIIAKEPLVADTSNENVREFIVIKIANGATQAGPGFRQARLGGHVAEMAVPFVSKKQVAYLAVFNYGREQQQVGLAVTVIIQLHHRGAKTIPNGGKQISMRRLLKVGPARPPGTRREVDLEMLARQE